MKISSVVVVLVVGGGVVFKKRSGPVCISYFHFLVPCREHLKSKREDEFDLDNICCVFVMLWYKVFNSSVYAQALHCCMTWILDLAIPSPHTSPSASSAAGANSSLN